MRWHHPLHTSYRLVISRPAKDQAVKQDGSGSAGSDLSGNFSGSIQSPLPNLDSCQLSMESRLSPGSSIVRLHSGTKGDIAIRGQGVSNAIVGALVSNKSITDKCQRARDARPSDGNVVPLSVSNGDIGWELQEDRRIVGIAVKEVDIDTRVDCLHEHSSVGGVEFIVHRVEGEVGTSFSRSVELYPHGHCHLRWRSKDKWNDKAGACRLGIVSEMEVIVGLDGLATIFSCQVEWTSAVESIGQVNAGGGWCACSRQAIINVGLAVLARESRWADALIVGSSVVNASGSILAGILGAGVKLMLTSNASEPFRTGTVEAESKISAESTVHAR